MPIEVEVQGQIFEFPDNTSREVMQAALAKRFPREAPAQVQDGGITTTSPEALAGARAALHGEDPVVKRGILAPVVETASGKTELGLPEVLAVPAKAVTSLMTRGYEPGTRDEEGVRNAAAAALATTAVGRTPGLLTTAPGTRAAATAAAERIGGELPRSATGGLAERLGNMSPRLLGGGAVSRAAESSLQGLEHAVQMTFQNNMKGPQDILPGLNSWLAGADISGPTASVARMRKSDLANALKIGEDQLTPGTAVQQITELALRPQPHTAESLLKARGVFGPEAWKDLQPGLVFSLGNAEGKFSIRALGESAAQMGEGNKSLLFGAKGPIREVVDDLGTLAPRFEALERQAGTSPWASIVVGLLGGVGSGSMAAPALVLGGNWALSRMLATPATAKPAAGFVRALMDSANTSGGQKAVQASALLLSQALSKETGVSRDEILRELQAKMAVEESA